MSLRERITLRLEMLHEQVDRGCGATREQAEVELMVSLAESTIPVLMLEGAPPATLTDALTDVAALLSDRSEQRARRIVISTGVTNMTVVGVTLSRSPTIVLITHASTTDVLTGMVLQGDQLIEDGYGPRPLTCLDRARARHFYPGLLRLVEREARDLVKGGDWNWGGEDGDGGDDHWHPEEMVRRVRRLRGQAHRIVTVGEVHDS